MYDIQSTKYKVQCAMYKVRNVQSTECTKYGMYKVQNVQSTEM
jgi:hypothetical protein